MSSGAQDMRRALLRQAKRSGRIEKRAPSA